MTLFHSSCPPKQPCDTSFKAIYLGDVHEDKYIDRWESPLFNNAENAGALTGMVFGGKGDALAGHIVDLTVTSDGNRDGSFEGNNFWGNYDTFSSNPAVKVPVRGTDQIKDVSSFKYDATSMYDAKVTYTDGTTGNVRVTVIQDSLGRTFMVPNENGTSGGLLPQPIQSISLGCPIRDCDNDYHWCPADPHEPVPCFTAGVRLMTAKGQRPVEKLAVGDLVETADNGLQPVRWIGTRTLDAVDLAAAPNLRPARIAKGALGGGLPKRDLLVSPQHRMLVRSDIAQSMFGAAEVLVAAKHLVGLEGVSIADDVTEVTYVHVLFDRHEVVFAEGARSESLFMGAEALHSVGETAQAEILALFPDLANGAAVQGARPFLTGRQGRDLAVQHGGVALQ